MTSTIDQQAIETGLTRARGRDAALQRLVPKMLGIFAELSKLARFPGSPVTLREQLELSAHRLGVNRIMLGVYRPVDGKMPKVFSAHVIDDPRLGRPEFYRYVGGTVLLMSWRRGDWENAILDHPAETRNASELLSSGLLAT